MNLTIGSLFAIGLFAGLLLGLGVGAGLVRRHYGYLEQSGRRLVAAANRATAAYRSLSGSGSQRKASDWASCGWAVDWLEKQANELHEWVEDDEEYV
jgi:hypothetical protein